VLTYNIVNVEPRRKMLMTHGKTDKKPFAENARKSRKEENVWRREFPLGFRVRNFLLWNSVDTSRFWNLTRSALATSTLRLETPLRLYFSLLSTSVLVSSSVLPGGVLSSAMSSDARKPRRFPAFGYFPAESRNVVMYLSTRYNAKKKRRLLSLHHRLLELS